MDHEKWSYVACLKDNPKRMDIGLEPGNVDCFPVTKALDHFTANCLGKYLKHNLRML